MWYCLFLHGNNTKRNKYIYLVVVHTCSKSNVMFWMKVITTASIKFALSICIYFVLVYMQGKFISCSWLLLWQGKYIWGNINLPTSRSANWNVNFLTAMRFFDCRHALSVHTHTCEGTKSLTVTAVSTQRSPLSLKRCTKYQ